MEDYCELIPCDRESSSLKLTDGEKVIVNSKGRVNLADDSSHDHVELCLDLSNREVTVKCLSVEGYLMAGGNLLKNGEELIVGPGAFIELLPQKQKFNLFFGKRASSTEMPPTKRKIEPEPTTNYTKKSMGGSSQSTIMSFFGSFGSSSPAPRCKWKTVNTLRIMTVGEQTPSSLIASFDLDGTLTETKSGRLPFRTTPDDWRFWHASVPKKLQATHTSGYRLVVFTNQGGMNNGNPPFDEFKIKIQAIMESIGGNVPLLLIAATSDDDCRKPLVGMWNHFCKHENQGFEVDYAQSYFIGDAAGRVRNLRGKKDFSCSDRKFAANVGLPFHTPEEYFLGEPPTQDFTWEGFNPFSLDYTLESPTLDPPSSAIISSSQEIVIFVGCPASGKTTFYKTHMSKHYQHVNRDTLGTWEKCVTETERVLKWGRSVVIDNTNPDPESRYRYIETARRIGGDSLPVRCFQFMTSIDQAIHNNCFRQLTSSKAVPMLAFDRYKSVFQEPALKEGFNEIVKVTINMRFNNPKLEKMYKKFYQ